MISSSVRKADDWYEVLVAAWKSLLKKVLPSTRNPCMRIWKKIKNKIPINNMYTMYISGKFLMLLCNFTKINLCKIIYGIVVNERAAFYLYLSLSSIYIFCGKFWSFFIYSHYKCTITHFYLPCLYCPIWVHKYKKKYIHTIIEWFLGRHHVCL